MDNQNVEKAIKTAGLEPPDIEYEITGDDPFFKSPLQLATGACASLVMLGSAIDEVWRLRGGVRQSIKLDADHAALSLLSMWLLRIDGESAAAKLSRDDGTRLTGQYECADGRLIHLQPGFPHHAETIVRSLGCDMDRNAVAEAVAARPAAELEDRLSEAGIPAVVVRDWQTWQQTPQGMAMKDVPTVEIEKIADSAPMPLGSADAPLAGIRVLDLTRVLAGPTCARTLGEYGADVLHVDGPHLPDLKPGQADTAHGKRMTFLDLRQHTDLVTLTKLLPATDVFVQSYRAGSLAARGLGPEQLAKERPGIVYVSVNCYGHHGPWQGRPGYDGNAMAATGIQLIHREEPSPGIAVAMNDYCTAYWGAYGAIKALARRATEGGSWHVRVSLTQSAMWFLRMGLPNDRTKGHTPQDVRRISEAYMHEEASPYGKLTQLLPALGMSETPPRWRNGTPMPGSSPPNWL